MAKIVVGVDGSACAETALRWALREASLRDAKLAAVLVWDYLRQPRASNPAPFDATYDEGDAGRTLDTFIRRALDRRGPEDGGAADAGTVRPDIERLVVCDLPAPGLLRAATGADLLVVGARGLGGFRRVVLGSVSEQVLHQATCPVAIVPEPDADAARDRAQATVPDADARRVERVVVATDGSAASRRAVQWALDEGRRRRAKVEVVHAWHEPLLAGGYPVTAAPHPHHWYEEAGQRVLDAALKGVGAAAAGSATVEPRLVEGQAASSILAAAEGADLLVTGTRGLSEVGWVLLGSVSRQLVHRATCPVVVLRPEG